MVRQKHQLFPSRDNDDQRILLPCTCYLPLKIISIQKMKDINWLFPVLLLIKELLTLIGWDTQQFTTNQMWQFQVLPSLDDFLHAKKPKTISFFPLILMINESCNLIGWEEQLARPNWKGSLRCCLPLITNLILKNWYGITWFLPEILMIQESCNLIGQDVQLVGQED